MNVYFAPMEGVTDAIYRRVHHQHFGGVCKYFMPFISPTHSLTFSTREKLDMSPLENAGVPIVPQVLTNNAAYFQALAVMLRDLGYGEINLNLGCPSGTVTAKNKGSGLLRRPDLLRSLLDGIFADPVLPVSVKTRIGFSQPEEWPQLLAVYREYPIHELIVHPRTRAEFYQGVPHRKICEDLPKKFIYNGDLFTAEACRSLLRDFPQTGGLMLGRGLVANPALAQALNGGPALTLDALISFHDDLYRAYLSRWPESAAVGRMHLMMKYLGSCFENGASVLRTLRKATTANEYEDAVYRLFREHPLSQQPAFSLELLLS